MEYIETNYKKLNDLNHYTQFGVEWLQDTKTFVIHNGFVFKITKNGVFNNDIKFCEYYNGNKQIIADEIKYIVKNKNIFLIN